MNHNKKYPPHYTPDDIRKAKAEAKRIRLELDLRHRIMAEDTYKKIEDQQKELLRKALLLSWGYDPSKKMRAQNMRLRQLYHRHCDDLIKDRKFLEIFSLLAEHLKDLPAYLKAISELMPGQRLDFRDQEKFAELEYYLELSNPDRKTL